ncbi:MAG TPA: hypothetical protein DCS66_17455, partial [Flavobacteriaceae bacterium]|nr:hypothetical protein [Flavobacteriaceae bacterium]
FSFYKTNEGYKLVEQVKHLDDIDIKYHWNIITSLMKKFSLQQWIKKKVPLTVLDKKQQSLMEFV